MRYFINSTINGSASSQQARSLEAADLIFASLVQTAVNGGDEVVLIDTKKQNAAGQSTVVRRHYVLTEQEKAERFERRMERHIASALERSAAAVTEWTTRLLGEQDSDPTYHMRWADNMFKQTAERHVALWVKNLRTPSEDRAAVAWTEIAKHLRDEVMRGARYGSRSSSACSNMSAMALLEAQAEMLQYIESGFEF